METSERVPERATTIISRRGPSARPETTEGGQRHAWTHGSWTNGRSLEAELEYQSTLAGLALIGEPEPILVGHQGRYAIRRLIGRGAMGAVYFAEDDMLGARPVAIKVVSSRLAVRHQLQDRLRREAWALALLNHPNVLTVHDVDHAASGELFIVVEYVDGPNLREWVAGARPSRAEILAVFTAAGRGLAAAHQKGLVHRDFKPDNVLLHTDDQGKRRVLVADFGLAGGDVLRPRTAGEPVDSNSEVSTHASFMGTPAYAPPEQRRGQQIDTRSDQYAFCVSLWEMLVGERPEPEPRERPRELPAWLYRLLRRGLAPRVDERWPDMATLLDGLAHTPGRRRRLAAVGGALLLGAGLVGAGVLLGSSPAPPAPVPVVPCAEIEAELDQLWSPTRRGELEVHLRGLELPYADALAADTLGTLDTAVASWREHAVEGCEHGERLRCHERWVRRFDRRVNLLAQLDAEHADHIHKLLAPLRDDALCNLYSASLDTEIQDLLDTAEEREALGEYLRARELAEDAWSRAGQLDSCTDAGNHSPEAAAAAYRLGHIYGENHEGEAALHWLALAVRHAIACEDDSMLLAGRLRRAKTFAVDVLEVEAAARELDEAQAHIDRFGEVPAGLELERELTAAVIELQGAEHAEAERRFDALLAKLEDRPLLASEALINKGVAAQALGRLDVARRAFARARELAARAYGRPPEADIALLNLGIATRDAGEEEDLARDLLTEASHSSQPGVQLRAKTALLELSYDPEEPGPARALAPELLVLVRAHPGQAPDDRAYALVWAGQVLADAGERDGLEALREAVEIFAEHLPKDPQRDRVELSLAWNYLELGERELARHHYEQVVARDPVGPMRDLVDQLGDQLQQENSGR